MTVGNRVGLHHATDALVKDLVVEIGRRAEELAHPGVELLHDLVVVCKVVMAHVVAVHQINGAALVATHDQMRVFHAARLVRQQHRAARPKIRVRRLHRRLVKRREIIRHGQRAGRG